MNGVFSNVKVERYLGIQETYSWNVIFIESEWKEHSYHHHRINLLHILLSSRVGLIRLGICLISSLSLTYLLVLAIDNIPHIGFWHKHVFANLILLKIQFEDLQIVRFDTVFIYLHSPHDFPLHLINSVPCIHIYLQTRSCEFIYEKLELNNLKSSEKVGLPVVNSIGICNYCLDMRADIS